MSARYQHGYLRCMKRKDGTSCWEFMWRGKEPAGEHVHRTTVIGSAEQYPTEAQAQEAVRGLRMQINDAPVALVKSFHEIKLTTPSNG